MLEVLSLLLTLPEAEGNSTPPLPLLNRVVAFTDMGILRKAGSWGSSDVLSCLRLPLSMVVHCQIRVLSKSVHDLPARVVVGVA